MKKTKERERAKEKNKTIEGRNQKFRESVRHGRIYNCVCCERLCFNNGVTMYTSTFQDTVDSKFDDITRRAIGEYTTPPKKIIIYLLNMQTLY